MRFFFAWLPFSAFRNRALVLVLFVKVFVELYRLDHVTCKRIQIVRKTYPYRNREPPL